MLQPGHCAIAHPDWLAQLDATHLAATGPQKDFKPLLCPGWCPSIRASQVSSQLLNRPQPGLLLDEQLGVHVGQLVVSRPLLGYFAVVNSYAGTQPGHQGSLDVTYGGARWHVLSREGARHGCAKVSGM